mgnify:CR=1 FL=1
MSFKNKRLPHSIVYSSEETISNDDWASILLVKEAINKVIEDQRKEGAIKGSLSADIAVYADHTLYETLAKLGDELRFVTITSKAVLSPLSEAADIQESPLGGLRVSVSHSTATKCVRCWHFIEDVGTQADHSEVCGRCIDNISGAGETRSHA